MRESLYKFVKEGPFSADQNREWGPLGERSRSGELTAAAYLRGLLEVAQLVRGESGLAELLPAVARVVSETLGFETVVINLYRPEAREYEVMTVHGNERARSILLGNVTAADTWEPQLDPRFLRRGAFFVPAEELEWDDAVASYTPQLAARPTATRTRGWPTTRCS